MFTKKEIKDWEEKNLASWAMKSKYSRGRNFKEKEHSYRSLYQRDRDRILHSAYFRRLELKTQVYVYHEGDYYRTRLTHTLEVAQIGRTIAKTLNLNEDLTEALCLAHDLGHPPFGHAGETALDQIMADFGGFDHNIQSLRIVDKIETRYPTFSGLNLAWETREGIVKHTTKYDDASKYLANYSQFMPQEQPTLEAQVMDKADEIAYNNHDLDDGIKSGILAVADCKKLNLWKKMSLEVKKKYPSLSEKNYVFNRMVIQTIINAQVTDLIHGTVKNLKKEKIKNLKDVKNHPNRLVTFSKAMNEMRDELRDFLNKKFYMHPKVARMSHKYTRFLKELFDVYYENPKVLDFYFQKQINKAKNEAKRKRVICDYISGMTDRYALEEYKKIFDPYEKL